MVYKAEKEHCQEYPEPASEDLCGGVARNYQVFEPLDFLAELTQHIPNKGEHLIRYYGVLFEQGARRGRTAGRGSRARRWAAASGGEGQRRKRAWGQVAMRRATSRRGGAGRC